MVIPFDDHIVHRGHGIFDTAAIVAGKIYDLEAHLDRFLLSAERSKLRLPGSRGEMTTSSCRRRRRAAGAMGRFVTGSRRDPAAWSSRRPAAPSRASSS